MTTNRHLAGSEPQEVAICAVYDARSYPAPGCVQTRARAYSVIRFSFRSADTARCATRRPIDATMGLLRFHRTAGAQGSVLGQDMGSGGKHARRHIGEFRPLPLTCLSSFPAVSSNDVRVQHSHIPTWLLQKWHVPPSLSHDIPTTGVEEEPEQRRPYGPLPLACSRPPSQTQFHLLRQRTLSFRVLKLIARHH